MFGQFFLSFYKIDSQSGETAEQTKETIKNGKKKWIDDEVQDLIELFVKIHVVRAQLDREMAKESKTKNRQAADEKYVNNLSF